MDYETLLAENTLQKTEIASMKSVIEQLEARVTLLTQAQFGKRSEKHHPLQPELDLFNEAEVIDAEHQLEPDSGTEDIAYTRKKKAYQKKGMIPDHLPRIHVEVECHSNQCPCCNQTMAVSTPVIVEELALLPAKHYVVSTEYQRLTCTCKDQPPIEATRPVRCLPGSNVHPLAIATIICQKYDNGLPLYRQEKMAKANNVAVSRENMARWIIKTATTYLQPFFNLLSDEFFEYDIAYMDETRIQVLKEDDRRPESNSQLWIRRGGRPDRQVILLDYDPSRGFDTADRLANGFKGTLITDAYAAYYKMAKQNKNDITNALCNDHSRRKFKEAYECLPKKSRAGSAADQALRRYAKIYKLEADAKIMSPEERHNLRQEQSLPLWIEFIAWAQKLQHGNVLHQKTAKALQYLLNHQHGLTRYLQDERLPISNIKAEHVAKAVAIPRKNFLFCDTAKGAHASALCFSMIETAKLHSHHVHQYITVLLTELPKCKAVADYEALLPWNITPAQVELYYKSYPIL